MPIDYKARVKMEKSITDKNINALFREEDFAELMENCDKTIARDYYGVACHVDVSMPESKWSTWGQAMIAIYMARGFYVNSSPSLTPQPIGMMGMKLILTREPLERFNPAATPLKTTIGDIPAIKGS